MSLLGVGSDLIAVVDLFGTREMMAELSPWLGMLAPHLGVFVVASAVFLAVGKAKDTAIHDLEEIQRCGEEMIAQLFQAKAQSRLRFITLTTKYRRWFHKRPGQTAEHQVLAAANCAETLRAYGYIRGRLIIWNERRRGPANGR